MHRHLNKSSLTNRLRRIMARICLAVLLAGLCLSPMAQPLNAVAALETFDCGNITEIPQLECEALVALYQSTNGPNWSINTGWLETNTPCSWYGVGCQPGTVSVIYLGQVCDKSGDNCESINLQGSIPPEFGNLTNLTLLFLDNNQLSGLPPEIGNLTNLTLLYLDNNQLSGLPPEIGNLSNLGALDLSFNQLTNLPPEFGNLTGLSGLGLSNNQLSSLPPEFGNLSNLDGLDLSNNQLSSLPPEFGNLSRLISLFLYNNLLSSLPPEFGNLSNLSWLVLSSNLLTSLPPEFGNLSSLQSVGLSDNLISGLPYEFGNLSRLSSLYLSNNLLTSLPPEFGNLSSLGWLDLSSNQLTNLPSEFSNLSHLGALFLYDNQLSSLPPEFGNLSNLGRLDLSNNQLSSLPPEFGNLTGLSGLGLSNNQLNSLPPEIGNLSRLNSLNLSNNLLSSLPSEIGNLSNLTLLNLSNNQLTSLPVELSNLSQFYYSDFFTLSYNRLSISNPDLLNFVNRWDPDWADTQTIPAADLYLRSAAPNRLEFAWTPIRYTAGAGEYELTYAIDPNGPFTVHGATTDKTSDGYLASGLPESTTYYARIRTYSQAHDDQLHDLWSEYSPTIAILNTPIDPVFGATLNYTNEQDLTTQVEVPPGAVSGSETLYFSTQTCARLPFKFASTGQIFNLGLYQPRGYTDDLLLSSPITLTLDYDDSHWIEENLELIFWDSTANTWIDAAQTCTPTGMVERNPADNQIVVTACRLGKYALVEVRSASYLPVVNQDTYLP
jgi:Leucine-rich repeat (LRR) protein